MASVSRFVLQYLIIIKKRCCGSQFSLARGDGQSHHLEIGNLCRHSSFTIWIAVSVPRQCKTLSIWQQTNTAGYHPSFKTTSSEMLTLQGDCGHADILTDVLLALVCFWTDNPYLVLGNVFMVLTNRRSGCMKLLSVNDFVCTHNVFSYFSPHWQQVHIQLQNNIRITMKKRKNF